jgi:hypothetical protein
MDLDGQEESVLVRNDDPKATMCFEIKRYVNEVPIPKADKRLVPSRIGEPKITGAG